MSAREQLFESMFDIAEKYDINLTNSPDMRPGIPEIGDFCGDIESAVLAAGYVNVSEAAIERAARAAYAAQMEDGDTPWEHFGGSSYLDYWRDQARAVVAALREEA